MVEKQRQGASGSKNRTSGTSADRRDEAVSTAQAGTTSGGKESDATAAVPDTGLVADSSVETVTNDENRGSASRRVKCTHGAEDCGCSGPSARAVDQQSCQEEKGYCSTVTTSTKGLPEEVQLIRVDKDLIIVCENVSLVPAALMTGVASSTPDAAVPEAKDSRRPRPAQVARIQSYSSHDAPHAQSATSPSATAGVTSSAGPTSGEGGAACLHASASTGVVVQKKGGSKSSEHVGSASQADDGSSSSSATAQRIAAGASTTGAKAKPIQVVKPHRKSPAAIRCNIPQSGGGSQSRLAVRDGGEEAESSVEKLGRERVRLSRGAVGMMVVGAATGALLLQAGWHTWHRHQLTQSICAGRYSKVRYLLTECSCTSKVRAAGSLIGALQRMNMKGKDILPIAKELGPALIEATECRSYKGACAAARAIGCMAFTSVAAAQELHSQGAVAALVSMLLRGMYSKHLESRALVRQKWQLTRHGPQSVARKWLWWIPLSWPQLTVAWLTRQVVIVPRARQVHGPGGPDRQPHADHLSTVVSREAAICALQNFAAHRGTFAAIAEQVVVQRQMVELLWTGTDIAKVAVADTIYNLLSQDTGLRNHFYSVGADIGLEHMYRTGNNVMRAAAVRTLMSLNPSREPTSFDRGETMYYR